MLVALRPNLMVATVDAAAACIRQAWQDFDCLLLLMMMMMLIMLLMLLKPALCRRHCHRLVSLMVLVIDHQRSLMQTQHPRFGSWVSLHSICLPPSFCCMMWMNRPLAAVLLYLDMGLCKVFALCEPCATTVLC
jgi:hypothetical protein